MRYKTRSKNCTVYDLTNFDNDLVMDMLLTHIVRNNSRHSWECTHIVYKHGNHLVSLLGDDDINIANADFITNADVYHCHWTTATPSKPNPQVIWREYGHSFIDNIYKNYNISTTSIESRSCLSDTAIIDAAIKYDQRIGSIYTQLSRYVIPQLRLKRPFDVPPLSSFNGQYLNNKLCSLNDTRECILAIASLIERRIAERMNDLSTF